MRRMVLTAMLSVGLLAGLATADADGPTPADHPTTILVRFATGASGPTHARALGIASARVTRQHAIVPGLASVAVDMDAELACALMERMPGVLYAEPDVLADPASLSVPNDPRLDEQWPLRNTGQRVDGRTGTPGADINTALLWGRSSGGAGVVVAVMDTGIDTTHPDLADSLWTNPGEIPANGLDDDHNGFIDDAHGWNFVADNERVQSTVGHGTHVAGIIAARRDNAQGISGVAWGATIMPVRVIGSGPVRSSTIIAALQYAMANGARVVNMSLTLRQRSQALRDALDEAGRRGVVVVVSAGNAGRRIDSLPIYPASYQLDNLIAVAATNQHDRLANFSNYGPSTVDLAAPGTSVLSTWPGGSYRPLDGTSMSAPHVAGVAAILLADHPGWTPRQVRDRIVNTARSVDALRDRVIGRGVLDAAASVMRLRRPPPPTLAHLGNGYILISWLDDSPYESHFVIQRQRFVDGRWIRRWRIALPDADTTQLVHRRAQDRWRFRVRAVNEVHASRWSRWRVINTRD